MKKLSLSIVIYVLLSLSLFAQNVSDSLVLISDLKYHSGFEKIAMNNFVVENKDTFNLFLAIDEDMTSEKASGLYKTYSRVYDLLDEKKVDAKKINSKIKITYSTVHSRFLNKYIENVNFSDMFKTGTYNCVTASMLYSIVFDRLKIPYKVMASSNHVYLVANPGTKSIVIETTNPGFEQAIFTGEFKQQYVFYLRSSKLISESEYKNKSVEEIFEEKFNEVKEVEFRNLIGFQYYNKALTKIQNNETQEGYELCQKAYFFYPDQQVKTLLYTGLLLQINKCKFAKVNEIDYLAQLSRYKEIETNILTGLFNNVIADYLQYTNKEAYCDSLFTRLTSQISDKTTLEELSFSYNMQMSYRYQYTDKVEPYIENAIKIKGNHQDANYILTNYIHRKLSEISDNSAYLDAIKQLELRYNYEGIIPVIKEYKLIAFLKLADESFKQNKSKNGENYIKLFEDNYDPSFKSSMLNYTIERTYHSIAIWYYHENNKTKSKNTLNQALKYVPNSTLIKSSVF
jgi:hypothetical protein